MTDRKYCEDCKLCFAANGMRFARCMADEAIQNEWDAFVARDLDQAKEYSYCSTMRSVGKCGTNAALFQPKTETVAA